MKESDLIFGIMASFGQEEYSINDLKHLLSPFNITESCLRTNLSRLKKRNILKTRNEGKKVFYSFLNKGIIIKSSVAHSFKSLDWSNWDKSYRGILYSVPETNKAKRHSIRKKLVSYRFVSYFSGFWIRPYHEKETFLNEIFESKHCEIIKFYHTTEITKEKANDLWKINDINNQFKTAIDLLEKKMKKIGSYSPKQALIEKMNIGNEIIHIIFQDPLLPKDFLSKDWMADILREKFIEWDKRVTNQSKPYWENIIFRKE